LKFLKQFRKRKKRIFSLFAETDISEDGRKIVLLAEVKTHRSRFEVICKIGANPLHLDARLPLFTSVHTETRSTLSSSSSEANGKAMCFFFLCVRPETRFESFHFAKEIHEKRFEKKREPVWSQIENRMCDTSFHKKVPHKKTLFQKEK
jgi:hypothetical protein